MIVSSIEDEPQHDGEHAKLTKQKIMCCAVVTNEVPSGPEVTFQCLALSSQ